jgi:hypothetical protein
MFRRKKEKILKAEENLPKEEEKIAARRAVRLAEKLRRARRGLMVDSAWWANGPMEWLGGSLIWLLNLYMVWPFFGREAFVTSYSGPVIPFLANLVSFSGLPLTYSIEIVNVSFFLLFPISFYWLMKSVSGKTLVALLAGLLVSLPLSPFAGARVRATFFNVEGPHMASLAVVPLAIGGLLAFLHHGGWKNLFLASLTASLVGLISPFGLLAYLIFAGIATFSEVLLGHGRLKLARLALVFVLMAGFSSFWYNPAFFFWLITGPMGEEPRMMISQLIPISFFVLPVLGAFGYLLFDRKPDLQPLFLGSFLTIAFMVIVLAGRGFMPSAPSRYIPELGLSLAFLFGVGGERLVEFWSKNKERWAWARWANGRAVNSLLLLTLVGLMVGIIEGREHLQVYEGQVLGYWTGVERGEIWQARERFGGTNVGMGYGITGLTGLGLVIMAKRVEVTKNDNK